MMKTEFIAWWGAILSTVVLAWDVFKWRRGKFDLFIEAVWGESLADDDLKVTITNRGSIPTTIESVWLATYRYLLLASIFRGRKDDLSSTNLYAMAKPKLKLPTTIKPGETLRMSASLTQEENHSFHGETLLSFAQTGSLYVHVKCSGRRSMYRVKVKPWTPPL